MRIITKLLGITLLHVSLTAAWGFIIEHKGKSAPNYQEWTGGDFSGTTLRIPRFAPRSSVSVGPSYPGEAAWKIHDTSTTTGSNFVYMRGITDEQAAVAMSAGWTLHFRVRVGDAPTTGPGPIGVIFATGSRRFLIQPYRGPGDVLHVKLSTGPGTQGIYHNFPAADPAAFHTFTLRYNPTSDTSQLFLNEILIESDYPGRILSENFPYLSMGSGDDNDSGEGHYARVRFESADGPAADCVFDHFNATHPLDEGWQNGRWNGTSLLPILNLPAGITVSPVTEEARRPAWRIADHGSAAADAFAYFRNIPTNKVAAAMETGWTLSTRLRVDAAATDNPRSIGVFFANGERRYQMGFGQEADGDPIIRVTHGPGTNYSEYLVDDAGEGYHLYEMIYDPCTTSATVYVDGELQFSNYTGRALNTSNAYVAFGSGSDVDTGTGSYQYVQFSFLPIGNDHDNDGMSDHFERQFFFDPDDDRDAEEDSDNDGLSNKAEAQTRTNPNSKDSNFIIPIRPLETDALYGDVTADGFLDARDLTRLLQIAAHAILPNAYETKACDLDRDEDIDSDDAEILMRLLHNDRIGNRITLPYTGVV